MEPAEPIALGHKRMTHGEKRERRKQMAEAIGRGRTVPEVAKIFEVGIRTVQYACTEFPDEATPKPAKRPARKTKAQSSAA